jgi:hypothetical protein
MTERRKLVLTVVDGARPASVRQAIDEGRAPVLKLIEERGTFTTASAAFPSVTPVCAAAIATGTLQDRHHIPGMNWYSRAEQRYIEYGSSFGASRRFGLGRQLADTVYAMNAEHLSADTPTVFESLDDEGVRTAGTTYLMYRGRHDHAVSKDTPLTRIVGQTLFRRSVKGPKELFYADIFASRQTACRSQMGMPGLRDQHSGCVGEHLVEHDLFDFLLLSLPDNDTHSHKHGPDAQVDSIAAADVQLARIMEPAGGPEAFLDEHAVVVMADHSHALVEHRVDVIGAFGEFEVAGPGRPGKDEDPEVAVCPSQRSAMVYVLAEEARTAVVPRLVQTALELEGVDLVCHRQDNVSVVSSLRGALAFTPGDEVADPRGGRWIVRGNLDVLDARVEDGVLRSDTYPDALARVHAALSCPTSGDVVLSAAPGYEFADWGGADHVGGGSHGSLHTSDSMGALLFCGVEPPAERDRGEWSIRDVAGMVRAHFGDHDQG